MLNEARLSPSPILYLFVTKAFFVYLQAPNSWLRWLPVHNGTEDPLLFEYADNMVLFLQGDEENLQRTELVVEDFCKDIGAKVNWDQTQGVWFNEQENQGGNPMTI